MKKKRIISLWDLDGSTAGYVERLVEDLERMRGPGDPIITAENIWHHDHKPYIKARIEFIKSRINWWRNLPVIAMGKMAFDLAGRIGYHRIVVSKAPALHPHAWTEKAEWSLENLDKNVEVNLLTGSKGIVYGRILYDDSIEFALDWLEHRPRGQVIMPVTPYNKDFSHPQVFRWNGENEAELEALMIECYEREDVHEHH